MAPTLDRNAMELSRLQAIIRQAIWDLELKRPEMALLALRYAHIEEAPLPASIDSSDVR